MPRKRSGPVDIGLNRVVIEPYTKIVRFDGIQWAIQFVVMAAIGHLLFGEEEASRKQFYKSKTGRENKEALLQLASQVYSYLDGTISEFADIDDYVFRVLTRVTVQKTDGKILGEPVFDVEIFKRFGRVSAKGVESEEHLSVTFVGQADDKYVSPQMNKVLKEGLEEFKFVKLNLFKEPKSAPEDVRSAVVENFPTLIIGDKPFAVKLKVEQGIASTYVQDGKSEFPINNEKDMVVFISKKSGWKPEILGDATSFESGAKVQREISQISERILEKVSPKSKEEDIVKTMKLDEVIKSMEEELKSVPAKDRTDQIEKHVKSIQKSLASTKEQYTGLKVEYQTAREAIENLDEKFEENELTPNDWQVARWKASNNKNRVREALVELQQEIKGDLTAEIANVLESRKAEQVK